MNEDSKSSFKSRLRQERFLRGWSQQALADQLGTTTVTVSRWERGTQFPGPMMRLKLCMLFEKTERELGLAPEESESVTPLAPQTSQGASVFTRGVESVADEAPEESTPAELRATPHSIQETSSIFLSPETKEPVPEHPLFASSSSLDHPRLPFSFFRSPAEWMRALTCLLLLVLMISLLLGLHHSPQAQLKGNLGQRFPAATIEPVPAPYGVSGHLVFDDALRDRQTGPMWFLSDPHQPFGCHFLSGAYDMRDVESNYCLASKTDFANFVYQIEMTTLQEQSGQAGRILFRVDDAQDAYYAFEVSIQGSYRLLRSDSTGDVVLTEGHSSAILQGDLHPNLLAVKANGKDLSLYVNFQLIAHVEDLSYTHGSIGVGVMVNTGRRETEVRFREAKVWAT